MTQSRVGFDLVTISRFEALYADDAEALATVFSQSEVADVGTGVDKWSRLAARFAAKEATFKALREWPQGASFHDVVVRLAHSGAPELSLSGRTQELANSLGLHYWELSLSHTDDVAGAVVTAS